jgi:gliding motility-associated-like protein
LFHAAKVIKIVVCNIQPKLLSNNHRNQIFLIFVLLNFKTMSRLKIIFLVAITLWMGVAANAQSPYTMSNSTEAGSSNWFVDPGGYNGFYDTNLNYTYTLCMPVGMIFVINFAHENSDNAFTLGTGDTLWIYDGTAADINHLIGVYVDQTSPGTIQATDNCLTFVLHTNDTETGNGREEGWQAWCQARKTASDTVCLGAHPYLSTYANAPSQVRTCNGDFFDSGGPSGNYGHNQDYYVRFLSDVGSYVHVEFSEFKVLAGDTLFIYDGIDTSARLIGKFTSADVSAAQYATADSVKAPPKDIFSSGYNVTGTSSPRALTFRFKSNGSDAAAGWKATVTCEKEIYHLDAGSSACPGVSINDELGFHSDTVRVNCANTQLYRFSADISVAGKYANDYMIQPIPYNPPFDLWEGTPLGMSVDDNWGPPTGLPFTFDFFGSHYDTACPGANGTISFNKHKYEDDFPWIYYNTDNISDSGPTPANSIFGVLEDIHPGQYYLWDATLPAGNIRYGVMGEYPCRTFVFNFWRVKNFGLASGISNLNNYNSYQMVIYEGTNIIEIHVRHRKCCATTNGHGEGIIGLLNKTGTQFIIPQTPYRGMQNPSWSVLGETNPSAREGWRFIPIAPLEYEIAWFKTDTNSQPISTETYAYVSADTTTEFICRIHYVGSNGDSYTVMDTVVFFLPDREISIKAEDTLICPDDSTQLSVRPSPPPANEPNLYDNMRYLWSTGDTTQTITVTPGTATQTYSCKVTFSDGCTRTATQKVEVKLLNQPRIGRNHEDVGDRFSICQGMEAILTADNIDLDSNILKWPTVGQGDVPSILIRPSQAKQYVLEATDTKNCTARDTITVEVTSLPVAAFVPNPDHVYVENGEGIVLFNNLSQNANSYYWNFGDKYSLEPNSTEFEPEHNYTRPGRYTIWLTAIDSSDCRDSVWQTIMVEVPYFLYMPTAFSPDGDGINEVFKPIGYGMDESVYELQIYNRWGVLVYRTTSPYDSWDGHDRNGKECPTGEYIYIIKTQTLDVVPKEYKGSVMLMR